MTAAVVKGQMSKDGGGVTCDSHLEVQNQGARQPPKPKLYVQRTKAKFNGAPGAEKRKAVAAPTKSKVKLVRRPLGEGKAGEGAARKSSIRSYSQKLMG